MHQKKLLNDRLTNVEKKNSLLTENLDLDYLEILIREKFVYTKKGEKIYVLKNDN